MRSVPGCLSGIYLRFYAVFCFQNEQGELFEVSSFGTKLEEGAVRPPRTGTPSSHPAWVEARHSNVMKRDFTVNGMLLDVSSGTLYDYVGAHLGAMWTAVQVLCMCGAVHVSCCACRAVHPSLPQNTLMSCPHTALVMRWKSGS